MSTPDAGDLFKGLTQEFVKQMGGELTTLIQDAKEKIVEAQEKLTPGEAKIFRAHPDARLPLVGTPTSAGYDLHAVEAFTLYPGEFKLVSTGLVIQPPEGFHVELIGRSGLGVKYGIHLAQSVGVIDRDYAGPGDLIKVPLHRSIRKGVKADAGPVVFKVGDRICQMVFRPTYKFQLTEVDSAPVEDNRDGFGSTGK